MEANITKASDDGLAATRKLSVLFTSSLTIIHKGPKFRGWFVWRGIEVMNSKSVSKID
jgi:hypothetical protein